MYIKISDNLDIDVWTSICILSLLYLTIKEYEKLIFKFVVDVDDFPTDF